MRRITIPMLVTLTALSGLLLFSSAKARDTKPVPSDPQAVTATFLNLAGTVLQPGQVFEVKWDLKGDGVKYFGDESVV